MANLEPDTQKVLTDGEEVFNTTQSKGWGVMKGKLDARILDLQNINNLDFTSQDSVLFDLKARKMAADLLFAWLKQDVYGFIEQASVASEALHDSPTGGFVERQ